MTGDIADLQRRLRELGHDPGPADGIRGRRTIAAIKAFQAAHGLTVDGLAGPKTLALLRGSAEPRTSGPLRGSAEPRTSGQGEREAGVAGMRPWYAEALRLKGLREGAGAADNPTILGWAKRLKLSAVYRQDSVAWCGLFTGHCISFALPDEPLPANPLGARNWLTFGVPAEPTLGAVLVFWRGRRSGWQGHVGFYHGEDRDAFHVLGGNQSDAVTVTRIARDRFLGARWPKTAPPPRAEGRMIAAAVGALSTNEA